MLLILIVGIISLSSCPVFAGEGGEKKVDESTTGEVRFLYDSKSPPFAFKKGDALAGFDIDLGEAIGKDLGVRVKWIDVPFDIRDYANILESDGADAAISAITITKVRKYFVDFTRPYFSTSLAVATRKDTKWDGRAFARGLEGKIVGVMKGTTGDEWVRQNLKADVKTYDSPLSLVRALKEGGNLAFAVVIDDAILDYLRSQGTTDFKIVENELIQEDYAIAVSNGAFDVLSVLNASLQKIELGGKYDRIYKKWFGKEPGEDIIGKK
ncbi:MAG: transporter substrate-binding domain-containing protein [Candidatus Auribacterota bacterium]|nr:transporter substrate-binding domain-containing protein [Candidatus Auribacterota bacterium]